MSDIPVFFLHGLAYAGLLFLVSSGLTLIFGMMNVLNFAHAAMYMIGAYLSYTIIMQMTYLPAGARRHHINLSVQSLRKS